jgi:hypothetical protein
MLVDGWLTALASAAGAAIASVSGFGLGSLLTPVLARQAPMGEAVALVALPHAVATAMRLLLLRRAIDWALLRWFGVASAAGGIVGALVASRVASPAVLLLVFGVLLISSGTMGVTGWAARAPASRAWSVIGGVASGFFGGLVGNQGGVRSAALLSARVSRDAFVATATASAMLVDAVRLPIYLTRMPGLLAREWPVLLVATAGAVCGTLAGLALLRRIPESRFRVVVSTVVLVLGVWITWRALR